LKSRLAPGLIKLVQYAQHSDGSLPVLAEAAAASLGRPWQM